MRLPVKKLSLHVWLKIFAVWTMAAVSLATQMYLNSAYDDSAANWFSFFFRQIPTWYLCALLTPVVIYFYDRFPLHDKQWKQNILRQILVALLILMFFSHLRLAATGLIMNFDVTSLSLPQYLRAFLSQIAWDLAIYSFIVIVIFADKVNTISKQQALYAAEVELRNRDLESLLHKAQMEALKLQLSPHFLFNTLNTISSLVRVKEYDSAIRVISRLGNLLRTTLYSADGQFVPLHKELGFAELYLEIELERFKDRLIIEKSISKDALHVQVPHFILQPLLENAIKHGIAKKSSANTISITAVINNNHLEISIFNEGRFQDEVPEKSSGIGLRNITSRLEKIYAEDFFFSLDHYEDKGVMAQLKIPFENKNVIA